MSGPGISRYSNRRHPEKGDTLLTIFVLVVIAHLVLECGFYLYHRLVGVAMLMGTQEILTVL